jgi:uncharacterized protein
MAPVTTARVVSLSLTVALLLAGRPAKAAGYAPLDCRNAASPAEKAVCRSYSLGQSEARMATLFGIVTALVGMGQRGDIGDQQRQWIKTRDACGADTSCLAEAYKARIQALSAIMDSIAARGPF